MRPALPLSFTLLRVAPALLLLAAHSPPATAQCPAPVKIETGQAVSFCIRADGTGKWWGHQPDTGLFSSGPSDLGIGSLVDVQAGSHFVLYLASDGTVRGSGYNLGGQLANPSAPNGQVFPPVLVGVPPMAQVAVGQVHALGLTASGDVWAWGANTTGQLGRGFTSPNEPPAQITTLSNVVGVACSKDSSFCLKSDGTVWGWGSGAFGILANGGAPSFVPIPVAGLAGIVAIDAYAQSEHAMAIKSDGSLWGWGRNYLGQVGTGVISPEVPTPVAIPSMTGVAEVSVGETTTLVRKADGSGWACGYNGNGQLGIGQSPSSTYSTPTFTPLVGMGSGTIAISISQDHALALRTGGVLRGWGANYWGQSGNPTDPYVPTLPAGITHHVGPCPVVSASSIASASLAGGVPITISGANLFPTATITLGGLPLVAPVFVSEETITGLTPALPTPGPYGLDVAIAAGTGSLPTSIAADYAVLNVIGIPQVGGTFDVRISSYPSKPLIFLGDAVPGPTPIGPYGYAGVGLSSQMLVALDYFGAFTHVPDPSAVLDSSGQWASPVNVPPIPGLAGTTVYGQAYAFSFAPFPPNTLFFPTNTVALTFVP